MAVRFRAPDGDRHQIDAGEGDEGLAGAGGVLRERPRIDGPADHHLVERGDHRGVGGHRVASSKTALGDVSKVRRTTQPPDFSGGC
jgi:hypothetical protein